MNINNNFLNIRKTLGLNQTEFAEKLETSQNLISKYEKGQVELPFKIINNLNKIFNININWILTNTGNMFNEESKDSLFVSEPKIKYNSFEEELLKDIKKLSPKRQEYYYHRIKADLIEEELNK
jgi:transcriptional regulator with XRE-family HTH domain